MRGSIPLVALTASALLAATAAATTPTAAASVSASASAASASASGAASATPNAMRRAPVAFRLAPPNTALSPGGGMMAAPGDEIEVTGGGGFDPATGSVRAGGEFTHYAADGSVHCGGTWQATELTGWTDFGGRRHGRHGGVISLRVTHHCSTMGEVHTDIPMTVTSTLHAPSGSGYAAGTTVADFTQPTGGKVTITTR